MLGILPQLPCVCKACTPYHGIVIMLVAKCPLHVHQQVLHRDVFTFGIYIKMPECACHLHPQIGQLEDQHIQSRWCQPFHFPTPPAASVPMPVACSLTHSGVSVRVWHSPVWGGRGRTPSTNCSALGTWWPSMRVHCPSMAYGSHLSPLPHPRGSPILLRCTPHQLAR